MFGRGESITLHRFVGQTRNAHGAVVPSWADLVIDGVGFAPGSSAEPGASYRVVTKATLYLPPGVAVSAKDQVTVRGTRYEVDGDMSGEWINPFTGWSPGSAVTLKKVTG